MPPTPPAGVGLTQLEKWGPVVCPFLSVHRRVRITSQMWKSAA